MGRLAGAGAQWFVAAALYLGFAGSTATPEIIAAAGSAIFIVGFTLWCRHARSVVFRTRASWLRILPRLLRALGIETVLVGGALLRTLVGVRRRGEVLSQPFDPGPRSQPAAGRRGGAVLAVSALAATLIIGFVLWSLRGRAIAVRVRTPSLRVLSRALRALGTETAVIGGSLLSLLFRVRKQGEMLSKTLDPQLSPAAGRRAIAVLAASAAPDGYVLAVKEDSLLLHRLVPRPPSPDRRWPI